MKIPEAIRIGGIEYEIKEVPFLHHGNLVARGYIDFDRSVIELSENDGGGHQRRCVTLWHEILHGIVEASGQSIEDEERVVDLFARGIYQVLQDNGGRLFDLAETGRREAKHG